MRNKIIILSAIGITILLLSFIRPNKVDDIECISKGHQDFLRECGSCHSMFNERFAPAIVSLNLRAIPYYVFNKLLSDANHYGVKSNDNYCLFQFLLSVD